MIFGVRAFLPLFILVFSRSVPSYSYQLVPDPAAKIALWGKKFRNKKFADTCLLYIHRTIPYTVQI